MNAIMKTGLSTVLLLTAGVLMGYAPAAAAQQFPTLARNAGNQLCLFVNFANNSVSAQQCGAPNAQRWQDVSYQSFPSTFQIVNSVNGRCLARNPANNTALATKICDTSDRNQLWQRSVVSAPIYRYQALGTNLFLTSGSATAQGTAPVGLAPLSQMPEQRALQTWIR